MRESFLKFWDLVEFSLLVFLAIPLNIQDNVLVLIPGTSGKEILPCAVIPADAVTAVCAREGHSQCQFRSAITAPNINAANAIAAESSIIACPLSVERSCL